MPNAIVYAYFICNEHVNVAEVKKYRTINCAAINDK